MAKDGKLNTKQQVFVAEYLTCWNASEAARRAGYNGQANVVGPRLLADVRIKEEIDARIAEIKMTSNEVLIRLASHARSNIADFAKVQTNADLADLGDNAQVIRKFKRKVTKNKATGDEIEELELELYDAQAALEKLGRHHRLFSDSIEISGPAGGPIQFTEIVVELPSDQ